MVMRRQPVRTRIAARPAGPPRRRAVLRALGRGADRAAGGRQSTGARERTAVQLPGPIFILAPTPAVVGLFHQRVGWLLGDQAVPAGAIVVLTASEPAARRIAEALAGDAPDVFVDTVQALGHLLLREQARLPGYSAGFGVIDARTARSVLREVLTGLAQPVTPAAIVHTLQAISRLKQGSGEAVRSAWSGAQLAEIRVRYDRALRSRRVMDRDDLVARALTLLRQHPKVLARAHERFRHVLVDGYSQLTRAETELITLLVHGHHQLFVVETAPVNRLPQGMPGPTVLDLRNAPEPSPQVDAAPVTSRDGRHRHGRPVVDVHRDLQAYLRVILDPHDDAAFARAIELLGIGPMARQGMLQLAGSLKLSLYATVPRAAMLSRLPARARASLGQFRNLIQRWQGVAETGGERALLTCVLEDSGYLASLRRRGDAAPLEAVDRLLRVAANGQSGGGASTVSALLRHTSD